MGENEVQWDAKRRSKKKRSLLQKAKKFGKRGRFGQGREIDRDTYEYFVRVLENLGKEEFEDEEAEALFVSNVFQQTEGEEAKLCGNQLVSRVIEKLLPKADAGVLRRFMDVLAEDLRVTAMDPFASHILEKLLTRASLAGQDRENEEFKSFATAWLFRVSKFMINNMAEFAYNAYASHILRSCFQCLSGVSVTADVLRSRKSRTQNDHAKQDLHKKLTPKNISEDSLDILSDASRRVREFENQTDLIDLDICSGVVQALLIVLSAVNPDQFKKLSKHLTRNVFPQEFDEGKFDQEPLCRMIETILEQSQVAKLPKLHKKLSDMYFNGNLLKLACHQVANYTVQKLISSCEDKAQFEKWYEEELDNSLEDILASGNTGVVYAIAKTCRRLNAKQSHFIVALMKAFHCYDSPAHHNKIAPLIVRMMTRDATSQLSQSDFKTHFHGSLILQELLMFQKPIKIVNSLLAMDKAELRELLADPKGSFITEAFMTSPTIGEKSRGAIVRSLQGELKNLACSKHGSRSFDTLWTHSSISIKELMASELGSVESQLKNDPFGKFIASKCALTTFKRASADWKQAMTKTKKTKELFADIIEPEPVVETSEQSLKDESEKDCLSPPKKKKKKATRSYLDDL